jgi:hypothetical protein
MKKYREEADRMASARLSHYGQVKKENEPEGLQTRGHNISAIRGAKKGGAIKPHGHAAHKRLDHRAAGGRVGKKGGKTVVNVIVAGQQPQGARPVPVPIPASGPPGALPPPPRPPIGAIPGGPPMMPPGGAVPIAPGAAPPGGMPLRKRGGAVKHHTFYGGAGGGTGRLEKIGKHPKAATREHVVNGI